MVLDVRNIDAGQAKAILAGTSGAKKTARTNAKGKNREVNSGGAEDDSVELTGLAGQISRLVNQMKAAPAVNPDLVSPVKEKIDQGKYEIEYVQVANKILDFESAY